MIVDSLTLPNTWYIFREKGVEVKVNIVANHLFSTYELTLREKKQIEIEILKTGASLIKVSPYEIKYLITTNGYYTKENKRLPRTGNFRGR